MAMWPRSVQTPLIRPAEMSGYFVLAMGKMGAGELNYSSDIDLIVFYDAACAALLRGVEMWANPSSPHAEGNPHKTASQKSG